MTTPELTGPSIGPLIPPGLGEGPRDLGFTSRVSGGATQVNLAWDALLEAGRHLGRAADISTLQREELATVNQAMVLQGSLAPHWRAPLLGVRAVALTARCLLVNQLVQEGLRGTESTHEAYRSAESQVQRWFQLGRHTLEAPYIAEHLAHQDGDKGLVGDWARSMAVLGGLEAFRLIASRFTRRGRSGEHNTSDMAPLTGFLAIKVLQDNQGLGRFEMDRNDLGLGDQTRKFEHQGEGSLHGWYEQMAEVSDEGDLAVTTVDDDAGNTSYLVHLPGLDLDITEVNREDGRGYLGLVDSAFNDSEQLADVVDEALEAVGAEPGDSIAVSGYSLGGIGATNLVRSEKLQQKYDFKAANSIGGAGQDKILPGGTSTTHIQDRRDPVPHLLGERHPESADRIIIDVAHHNEDVQSGGLFGGAHDYQHYLDIIEELEQNPQEHLSTEDQREHFDSFAELYSGHAETTVFETEWTENPDPDLLLPHEQELFSGKSLEALIDESMAPLVGDAWDPLVGDAWDSTEDSGDSAAETGPVPDPGADTHSESDPEPDTETSSGSPAAVRGGPRSPGLPETPVRLTPGEIVQPQSLTPAVIEDPTPVPRTPDPAVPEENWLDVQMPVHHHDHTGGSGSLGGGGDQEAVEQR